MTLQGFYRNRKDDLTNRVVTCVHWTATDTHCVETRSWFSTWNIPTNAIIPASGTITERHYYKDPSTKMFICTSNTTIVYNGSVKTTNTTPTYPIKIAEPPLSFHGIVRVYGTNGINETTEGDVTYKIDTTKSTRPWYVVFIFRISAVSHFGQEEYLKYSTDSFNGGGVYRWFPNMATIVSQFGRKPQCMWRQGYYQTQVKPSIASNYFVSDAQSNEHNNLSTAN